MREFRLFYDPMLLWGQYFFAYRVLKFIFPDDNADIFATTLLMLYYNFSAQTFSSIVMTTLYTSSNRFFGTHKALSDGRAV